MLGHQDDLVIAYRFSFDFTWKDLNHDEPGGMVHPQAVHYTTDADWLTRISENLHRVKAIHVPRMAMDNLLKRLESCPNLKQLEIDTLAIHHQQKSNYTFANLRLLLIDEIKLLTDQDKPTCDSKALIGINATRLQTLILGADSLSYMTFTHPNTINSLTIDRDSRRKLQMFTGLTTLRLNQAQFTNFLDISKLLQFRQLTQLFCNTHRLESTSYQPTETEVKYLENMYQQLQLRLLYPSLVVYFNHVELKPGKQFKDYHFERNLVNTHYHNYMLSTNGMVPCESMTKLFYMDLCDETFELSRTGELELTRMFQLYRNIRIIVLDNSNGYEPVNEIGFARLLNRCDMLAELTICNAGFPAIWYKGLDQFDALSNLVKLALSESIGFAGHVKFEFLSHFKHLLRFTTNLATCTEMIDLVRRMQVSVTMGFQFWSPQKSVHSDIVIQKLNEGQLSLYHRTNDPDGEIESFTGDVLPFEEAIEYLLSNADDLFCGHWIEDLP